MKNTNLLLLDKWNNYIIKIDSKLLYNNLIEFNLKEYNLILIRYTVLKCFSS